MVVSITMTAFAVIIWIGVGKNPIDSEVAARVWTQLFVFFIIYPQSIKNDG